MTVVTRLNSHLIVPLFSKTKIEQSSLPSPFSILNFLLLSSYSTTIPSRSPNDSVFADEQRLLSLSKRCSTMNDLKQFHARLIQTGFEQNLFVIGKVIVFCAVSDGGDMDYAVSVFDRIENPDAFLWNTMLRGFGRTNKPKTAFSFFSKMQEKGFVADSFTFSFLIKVSGQIGSVMLGKQLHCNVLKHGLGSHVFVRNTLIHMYGMFKDIATARYMFDKMPSSDLVAWNTIIDCYAYCGMFEESLNLFLLMLRSGIAPDEATLVVTFSACAAIGDLDFGRWVHYCIKHNSYVGNITPVSNSLIDMYAKCGAVEEAFETFDNMAEKSIITWNTMIMGLATHGHADEALALFSKMLKEKHERPNDVSFLGVLCACSHRGMVDEGKGYFEIMRKDYHIKPTLKHYGCMVDMLGRAGFVEEAYRLIKSMPMECNAIVWRTLLAACRMHRNIQVGEKVRSHLLELEPDHSSDYVLLANIYASTGQWNEMLMVRKSMHDKRVHKPEPGNSCVGIH